MKYLILIVICSSLTYFFTVQDVALQNKDDIFENCEHLNEMEDRDVILKEKSESPKKKCPYHIPNIGDSFNESESYSRSKVDDLFDDVDFSDYYEEDNEFNVSTNDAGPGKSRQRTDPRKLFYSRFVIDELIPKGLKSYGVIEAKLDTLKAIQEKQCEKPSFYRLRQVDKQLMDFYLLNIGLSFKVENIQKDKKDFIFRFNISEYDGELHEYVSMWGKNIIFDGFFSRARDSVKNSFMANRCNKSISMLRNSCKLDLSFDMQYIDFFYIKTKEEMGVNIYCKKSSDKKWILISSYLLKE